MGLFAMFPCFFSIFACLILSVLFVSSLYVWNSNQNRDHPSVIRKRMISVLVVAILSPFITQCFITDPRFTEMSMMELHGFRRAGLIEAAVIPLLLTMVLFLGPISMELSSGLWRLYAEPMYWFQTCDAGWLRNYVVAPFSEEFTFRACMLPLLLQCFQPMTAIFICPLFFGLGHVHHTIERVKFGMPLKNALIMAVFQCFYTSLFGLYSALLFVKTGHFVAPLFAHSFCNIIGVPDFNEVLNSPANKKWILIFLYVLGVVLWCVLLPPLTSHTLYKNGLYNKLK